MEIIDSHPHWGPSVSMGIEVTTQELLDQAAPCGVTRIVVFPFPSQALADSAINAQLLTEAGRISAFIPYCYIKEFKMTEPKCATCSFRAKYDRKPQSLLGRLWRWHITWCPGWKAYMKSLPEDQKTGLLMKYRLKS